MHIKKFISMILKMLHIHTRFVSNKTHCDDEKTYTQRIKRVDS